MARALRGDLGMSYQERRPVTAILGERIPVSLALTFAALFAECALGVAAGIAASVRRFRWALSPLAVLGSVPTFAVGIALQLVFAHLWGVLPLDGLGRGGSWGRSLILPVVALALPGAIAFGRVAREQLEGLLQSDGARTAYAKGASPMRVLCIHIVPQVAPSLLALVPPRVGSTLSGALVVETLFRLPGLGSLAAQAVFDGDLPVVVGVVLTTTSIVVVVQTAADVLATAVGGPKLNFPQAPRGTRPPSLRGPR
jgi:peptide/nickel transport system permease protein